jgi:hypothetical protein
LETWDVLHYPQTQTFLQACKVEVPVREIRESHASFQCKVSSAADRKGISDGLPPQKCTKWEDQLIASRDQPFFALILLIESLRQHYGLYPSIPARKLRSLCDDSTGDHRLTSQLEESSVFPTINVAAPGVAEHLNPLILMDHIPGRTMPPIRSSAAAGSDDHGKW